MDTEKLYILLKELEKPVAYDHFINNASSEVVPPFIIYREQAPDNTKADNVVYYSNKSYLIDLVTAKKDTALEEALENKLNENDIPWEKSEAFIDSEQIYQISYFI